MQRRAILRHRGKRTVRGRGALDQASAQIILVLRSRRSRFHRSSSRVRVGFRVHHRLTGQNSIFGLPEIASSQKGGVCPDVRRESPRRALQQAFQRCIVKEPRLVHGPGSSSREKLPDRPTPGPGTQYSGELAGQPACGVGRVATYESPAELHFGRRATAVPKTR
jgi:hypothetical protein